jgi:hypothetical protein
MSADQVEQHNARNRVEAMSRSQVEQQREGDLMENMSADQVDQHNSRNRMEAQSSIQIQQRREADLKENMAEVQVEQHNSRNRNDALGSVQIEHRRQGNRLRSMSPEQRERLQQRSAVRYSQFKSVKQTWDDENPCQFCFYVPLISQRNTTKGASVCCKDGEFLKESSVYPKLLPLPEGLKRLCITRGEHIGAGSAKYNNILCIGSTGVENAAGGGYVPIVGDHAVKMNGRSYHFLSNRPSGGLSYFTFDGLAKAQEHATELNSKISETQRTKRGITDFG